MRRLRMAAGALLGAFLLTAAVTQDVTGSAAARAQTTPIHHVVVLYLENHTFDNVLGYWCDQHPGRCLGMPSQVTLSDGTVVTPGVTPDKVPAVDHSTSAQQEAVNGGLMNGWQKIKGCGAATGYACISGYKPSAIPNLTRLAQNFTVSDHTFSMAQSPSFGGHLYAVMASLDGFTGENPSPIAGGFDPGWGCDSNLTTTWRAPGGKLQSVPSCVPDPSLRLPNGGAFEPTPVRYAPTIMDRLSAAGLTWRIYSSHYGEHGYGWAICPSFAECLDTNQVNSEVEASQFVTDANSGHLPNFSIITPGGVDVMNSQHNDTSMLAGDNWIGQIASAVMNGPEWRSTALFITYDDCGCFYDQVPPRLNPDGTREGPRVPLVIVSPYARPGYTDSTPTTFNGILAYVEQNFRLTSLGVNDAAAYPFTNAFNYLQVPLGPVLMVRSPLPPGAPRHPSKALLNDPT